ncbi:hypothetical protein DL768_011475 [Monosporascus sp. mg162]|nr:hypothetical protein DL768_011475 [Monosporascus sp. mg162]
MKFFDCGLALLGLLASVEGAVPDESVVTGAYIVEFNDGADASALYDELRSDGMGVNHRLDLNYRLFKGASFRLTNITEPESAAAKIFGKAQVKQVWPVRGFQFPKPEPQNVGRNGTGASRASRKRQSADNYSPHVMTQVDKLRAEGFTGKGIRIGVVDSGIDYNHPALGGCFGEGCIVSYGWDLAGDEFASGSDAPMPDPDPYDNCQGHGTHVAGIIMAQENELGFTGVAPDVTLGMYKTSGCAGYTTNELLLAAFNRAYEDGSDIISCSAGDDSGWATDPWAIAASRIAEAGVPVVVALGNSGDMGMWTTASPASGSQVAGIGSAHNTVLPTIVPAGLWATNGTETRFGWREGTPNLGEMSLTMPLWATSYNTTAVDDACEPLPEDTPDLSTKIVLLRHASACPIETQGSNVAAKGGQYIMVYTEDDDTLPTMYVVVEGIVGVGSVTASQGAEWIKALSKGEDVTLTIVNSDSAGSHIVNLSNGITAGYTSPFTSWGPTWETGLKPQFIAPGGWILSTFPLDMGAYSVEAGTSMACPFAAGVFALIGQKRGTLDAKVLRDIIAATSKPNLWNDGTEVYDILAPTAQQGAGLVQAYDAAYATCIPNVSGLSFNDSDHFVGSHTFSVQNTGNDDITFTLGHAKAATVYTFGPGTLGSTRFPNPTVEDWAEIVFESDSINVPAGGSAEVTFTVEPPSNVNQTLLPVYSGYILLNGTNDESLSVPYVGVAGSLHSTPVLRPNFFENGLMGGAYLAASDNHFNIPVAANMSFSIPKPGSTPRTAVYPKMVVLPTLGSTQLKIDVVALVSSPELEMTMMTETKEMNAAKADGPTATPQPPNHSSRPGSTTASIAEPVATGDNNNPAAAPTLAPEPEPEPDFPLLQDNASSETLAPKVQAQKGGLGIVGDDNDDEPAVAKPFARTASPDSGAAAGRGGDGSSSPAFSGVYGYDDDYYRYSEKAGSAGSQAGDGAAPMPPRRSRHKMHKFTLYETASRYYIVGGDVTEKRYRILKIDRNTHDSDLSITDDRIIYSQREMRALLDTIDDGNRGTGGIKQRSTTWGLLGFIKFTGPYYMLLITKKSTVAMIGGHYVYQVDGTELIPLTPPKYKPDVRNTEESRFLAILNNLDLTRSFYYSYSYDITRSLQHNITRERTALINGFPGATYDDYNSMFVWNSHLLAPASDALHGSFDWCRPIIHGYIDQAAISIYGRTAHITIIARRSRYFAGARFLKRGANDLGYVANDVETEQIVSESLTTSFHLPGPKLFASPQYTSYVQHRGSIPLYWTQDNTGVTPKPPIELNLVDPFYTAAALHFDNLFERYGSPIYVLNLVKAKERTPRESKLLAEYTNAINYLNQFLPPEHQIIHKAWDMSRAAKSRDQNVIGTLEGIAESVVTTTDFFHNGDGVVSPIRVQNGVARTNCIDCLDRTNAAQFVIGKRALGYQLHALGIIEDMSVEYDTDAVNLFTHMWHDHGDTIAVQYGGSQLVNTMETYRKINQWTSHSRDMIESFKRYYNNSFMDSQRQEAYNLFLGNYIFAQGQPMLWDLSTDYYLHHADPRAWSERVRPHYIHWYTPKYLEKRTLPVYQPPKADGPPKPVSFYDDYWLEYYRPATLSSFGKMLPYKMNSTIKYIPLKSTQEGKYDLSPFRVRNEERDQEVQEKKKSATKKEVVIVDPHDARNDPRTPDTEDAASVVMTEKAGNSRGISIQRWLQPMSHPGDRGGPPAGIMKEQSVGRRAFGYFLDDDSSTKHKQTPQEKFKAAQWTFTQVVHESLNPSVSAHEMEDYASYVTHPQTLPLVVSNDEPYTDVHEAAHASEYRDYLYGSRQTQGLDDSGGLSDGEVAAYADLLRIADNPLTVVDEDYAKKRYRAYRKWLRGKSLFKQQPVD